MSYVPPPYVPPPTPPPAPTISDVNGVSSSGHQHGNLAGQAAAAAAGYAMQNPVVRQQGKDLVMTVLKGLGRALMKGR